MMHQKQLQWMRFRLSPNEGPRRRKATLLSVLAMASLVVALVIIAINSITYVPATNEGMVYEWTEEERIQLKARIRYLITELKAAQTTLDKLEDKP